MKPTKTEKAMLIVSIIIATLLFALAVIEVISLK
jgi:cell division protein FtsL